MLRDSQFFPEFFRCHLILQWLPLVNVLDLLNNVQNLCVTLWKTHQFQFCNATRGWQKYERFCTHKRCWLNTQFSQRTSMFAVSNSHPTQNNLKDMFEHKRQTYIMWVRGDWSFSISTARDQEHFLLRFFSTSHRSEIIWEFHYAMSCSRRRSALPARSKQIIWTAARAALSEAGMTALRCISYQPDSL